MKRFSLIVFAAFLLTLPTLLGGSRAVASVLSSHLTFDGLPDTIDDDSRSNFFDVDMSGTITGGDVAFGIISVSDFSPSGTASPDEIATVFSVTVLGPSPTGLGFSLGPTPFGTARSLDALLGGVAGPFLTANPTALPAGSIGVVVNLSGVNPLVPEVASPPLFGALGAPFAGLYELTLGFSSAAVPDSTGAVNLADYFDLAPAAAGAPLAPRFERAGMSVLAFGMFPTVAFIPVPSLHLDPVGALTFHDISLYSGNINPNPLGFLVGGPSSWGFVDDSDFLANPPVIPEPASILIWGLGFTVAAGLGSVRRRRLAT